MHFSISASITRSFSVVALAVVVGCSTPSSVAPISFPLAYKTMASPGDFPTLPPCATLADVQVTDVRADRSIGKRFVEGNASATAPVTVSSDVAAWVRSGALETLKRSGTSFGNPSAPVLRISVEQITTNENIVHRSGYDGRIVISGQLIRLGSGSPCWRDRADGAAENYGYSGSIENYQETLNHALDRAMIHLLSIPEFKRAICSCGSER
jgi:hypothetical protein